MNKRFQRILASTAIAVVAGAGFVAVAVTPAQAADQGALIITSPGFTNSGLNIQNLLLTTASPCPTGDSHISRVINATATNPADQAEADRWTNGTTGRNIYSRTTAGFNSPNISTSSSVLQSVANSQTPALQFVPGIYTIRLECRAGIALFGPTSDFFLGQIQFTSPTAWNVVVANVNTTTTLSASPPSPSNTGTPVTFTASVSGAPTGGTVQFSVNGAPAGAPAPVTGGVATLSTSFPTAGVRTIDAVYSGAAGFNGSTATQISYTTASVPAVATTSTLSVTPTTGGAFQSVTLTGGVTNNVTPAAIPTGSCSFKNGAAIIATVPVTATGACIFTSTSFGSGTYAFSFDFVPAGNFLASTSNTVSATYAGYTCIVGDQCVDPQTVVVTVPAGNISIDTPYTPGNPFNLGTLVLSASGTSYSVSAPFGSAATPIDGVTIVDTRAGALPFTAQIASTNFANGASTISNSLLGFTGVTPAYVAGNAINAGTNPVITTDRPAGQISTTGATFATGTGPGSVNVFGTLSLSNVPTSTPPGLYTATVTFTIS